jgi:N-acetylmuramoyl-L-alanine amidase
MKIQNFYSPNFDKKKRPTRSIKIIVIHYTGMQSERESIARLTNPKFKVSSHLLITKNGKILRLVHDNKTAWHAGKSFWGNYKNLNKNSIGIELVNKGHQFGYTNYKTKQIDSLISVCKKLIKKYKIKEKNIVGHSDISPSRKIDPGEKFPWKKLSLKKVGVWHNCKIELLKKSRRVKISKVDKTRFIKNLTKFGYCFAEKKNFRNTIKAFQRRFRKELINGKIDKECFIIAKSLLK